MPVHRLSKELHCPAPALAEGGLLAVGGDLRPERLLLAYRSGIFPWYSAGDPILWWSPDPRLILFPEWLHVSRRLQRLLKQGVFRITTDTVFGQVIRACAAAPRPRQDGTWITPEMIDAYCGLHRQGYAHSFEAWHGDNLAGGLYGISIGGCFFGESMFSWETNASKAAFVRMVRQCAEWGIPLIDCQLANPHLLRLGAREVPRSLFLDLLEKHLRAETRRGPWTLSQGL